MIRFFSCFFAFFFLFATSDAAWSADPQQMAAPTVEGSTASLRPPSPQQKTIQMAAPAEPEDGSGNREKKENQWLDPAALSAFALALITFFLWKSTQTAAVATQNTATATKNVAESTNALALATNSLASHTQELAAYTRALAEEAASSSKIKMRAYVYPAGISQTSVANNVAGQTGGPFWRLSVFVENHGETPTRHATIEAHAKCLIELSERNAVKGLANCLEISKLAGPGIGTQSKRTVTIGPKSIIPVELDFPQDWSNKAARGEVEIFIYGRIQYHDVFGGGEHATEFCYANDSHAPFDPKATRNSQEPLGFHLCDGFNRSDNDL